MTANTTAKITVTVIAITTFKGGIGKTTTARDLSAALADRGARVLAIDLDRTQRHLMKFTEGVSDVEFKALTAGRLPGLIARTSQQNKFDFIVIDCPPALSKETGVALSNADVVIAPVVPEYLPADGLAELTRAVHVARDARGTDEPALQVLVMMLDTRDETHFIIEKEIRDSFPSECFPQTIKREPAFNWAAIKGCSVLQQEPKSQGAKAFRALAKQTIEEARRG